MKIKILLVSTLLTSIGIVGCQTGGPVDETSVGIGADGVFNDRRYSSSGCGRRSSNVGNDLSSARQNRRRCRSMDRRRGTRANNIVRGLFL